MKPLCSIEMPALDRIPQTDVPWQTITKCRIPGIRGMIPERQMDQVLKIVCDGTAHECWMHLEDGRYQEYLY